MRILFLQNIANATGGIANVNISLANQMIKDKNEVFIYSIRNYGKGNEVKYAKQIVTRTINEVDEWNCPLYSDVKKFLIEGKIIEALKKVVERKKYDKKLYKDYKILANEIGKISPDIIINSHYELLDAIPNKYLCKVINHYHTNFNQILQHNSQIKIFKKYKEKIGKFVWLTKKTKDDAVNFGIENSIYIYNPLRFKYEKQEPVEKKLVFLGRFSKEKRLDLAIKIFSEVVSENNLKDWELDIYGIGELDKSIKRKIKESENINLKGIAENPENIIGKYYVMMLTSEFEGFPLVVLEANECGVPVIAFDFGESVKEVIKEQTGIVVEQNNIAMYKEELLKIMQNEERRNKKALEAKKFAKGFIAENIIKEWYTVFTDIEKNIKERNLR